MLLTIQWIIWIMFQPKVKYQTILHQFKIFLINNINTINIFAYSDKSLIHNLDIASKCTINDWFQVLWNNDYFERVATLEGVWIYFLELRVFWENYFTKLLAFTECPTTYGISILISSNSAFYNLNSAWNDNLLNATLLKTALFYGFKTLGKTDCF